MGRKPKSRFTFITFLRPLFTVLVLSSFVLGISFFVKTLATSDSRSLGVLLRPIFARLHIDEKKAGQVAGEFVERISQTGVVEETAPGLNETDKSPVPSTAQVDFKIAILSDTHQNHDNLRQALDLVRGLNPQFLFFLGDYTNYGESASLVEAKKVMEAGGVDYLSLPGDHDLYKSVGPQNFIDVFGKNNFVKVVNGVKFVGMDNSANYTTIGAETISWFESEVQTADFVLLSQPLYHPTFNVVMGVVDGEENVTVRAQALELLKIIRDSPVKAIIAGDQHNSSQNKDPSDANLSHIVVGALTEERNFQTPRFSLMTLFKNGEYPKEGSYQVEDVLLQ